VRGDSLLVTTNWNSLSSYIDIAEKLILKVANKLAVIEVENKLQKISDKYCVSIHHSPTNHCHYSDYRQSIR